MMGLSYFWIDGGTYLGFIVCITLLMFILIMRSFDLKLRRKFTRVAVAMIIALAAGALELGLLAKGDTSTLIYAALLLKYILEGYMEIAVIRIVGRDYKKIQSKLLWIPFIVISILICTAPVNPSVFYFDSTLGFVRGSLGYSIFIEAGFYLLVGLCICVKKWFTGYQRDALIILFMLAIVSTGVLLEEAYIFDNCTLTSSSIGVLFVYVYMYAERYNVDSVSMCYKRRCFYSDAAKYAKQEMAIISMDLNDLKYINDNYGHQAGDVALLTFAEVCRSVKTNKFILYRTGGDEFMILGIKSSQKEAENLITIIKEKLKETPYTCSFGLHMYKPGEDFEEAVVKADKAMYDDKHIYKSNKNKQANKRDDRFDEKVQSFSNDIDFFDEGE